MYRRLQSEIADREPKWLELRKTVFKDYMVSSRSGKERQSNTEKKSVVKGQIMESAATQISADLNNDLPSAMCYVKKCHCVTLACVPTAFNKGNNL